MMAALSERGKDTTIRYQYRMRFGEPAAGYGGWTYTTKEDYEAKSKDPANYDTKTISGELRGGSSTPLGV